MYRVFRLGRLLRYVVLGCCVIIWGAAGLAAAADAVSSRAMGTQTGGRDSAAHVALAAQSGRALPLNPTWAAYYGAAADVDVERLGRAFDLVVIDADPDASGDDGPAFDTMQIATLKAHGAKVLSYLNFGACETSRSYWDTVPAGFVSCRTNTAARLGHYQGYPEYWMNVGNPQFQHLIVDYVAARLAAAGVDGFVLDNVEVLEHGDDAPEGPCDAACRQGGLDLVAALRRRYPNLSIVLNNAPTEALHGTSGGVTLLDLVDGVFAEDVFLPTQSRSLVAQLRAWRDAARVAGRNAFFVGTLDYATSCAATAAAGHARNASARAGFSPAVETVDLTSICWWPWLGGAGGTG